MINERKAALHNLGCKVNAYETEAMQQLLMNAGYKIVPFDTQADVYVINTCSVTNIADRKSRQMLHRARKMNPDAVVVAAGCYVQTAHDKTHLDVDADIIIGNNKKHELVRILEEYFGKRQSCDTDEEAAGQGLQASGEAVGQILQGDEEAARQGLYITDIGREKEYENLQIDRSSEHTRAFIKVQDGCNQFCAYCIIPYARGRIRSRHVDDVTQEVGKLTAAGVKEIVLTGIHLSSYGMERNGGEQQLLRLIRAVAAVHGVERIRLGSLEPRIVTEHFARELGKIPQFCPHFHLSLQSGSDTVLQRMNRRYNTAEYENACRILRETFELPALTTDVIVGFPGESEEEFAQTRRFLEKLALYETHIFKYSRREGTRAASMPDQIPESIKNTRSAELIALGRKNMEENIRRWDGREAQVLFEEKETLDGVTYYTGYTKEYIRVLAESSQDVTNRVVTGKLDCTQPGRVMLVM